MSIERTYGQFIVFLAGIWDCSKTGASIARRFSFQTESADPQKEQDDSASIRKLKLMHIRCLRVL